MPELPQSESAPTPESVPGSADTLTDDQYTIGHSLIERRYTVTDGDGNPVLRGRQDRFSFKPSFSFLSQDGEERFSIEAGSTEDTAGSYTVIDLIADEPVAVLDDDISLLEETWIIRHPDTGEERASIHSQNRIASGLRHVSVLSTALPDTYDIRSPRRKPVGHIASQLSLSDRYTVSLDESTTVPTEIIIVCACVITLAEN